MKIFSLAVLAVLSVQEGNSEGARAISTWKTLYRSPTRGVSNAAVNGENLQELFRPNSDFSIDGPLALLPLYSVPESSYAEMKERRRYSSYQRPVPDSDPSPPDMPRVPTQGRRKRSFDSYTPFSSSFREMSQFPAPPELPPMPSPPEFPIPPPGRKRRSYETREIVTSLRKYKRSAQDKMEKAKQKAEKAKEEGAEKANKVKEKGEEMKEKASNMKDNMPPGMPSSPEMPTPPEMPSPPMGKK